MKQIVPELMKWNLKIQTSKEKPVFMNNTENCIDTLKEAIANLTSMHNNKSSCKKSQIKFKNYKDESKFNWFEKKIEG